MIQFQSVITGSVLIIVSHNDIEFFSLTPNVYIQKQSISTHGGSVPSYYVAAIIFREMVPNVASSEWSRTHL